MGVVFRQSVKATVTTITGAALGALILYLQPGYLTTQEIGFSRYLITWGALVQYIALMGGHLTVLTFLPRYADGDARRKTLLGAAFLVPLIATIGLTIPYLLLKGYILQHFKPQDIPYISRYYTALPVMVVIWSAMTLTDTYLVTRTKVAVSSFIKDVVLRLGNLVLIFLYAAGWISFAGFVGGTVLAYLLPTAAMIWVARATGGFGLSLRLQSFSRIEWREIIRFAQYHLLAGLALNLVGAMDALLLPGLDRSGLKSLAPYSISIFMASMLSLPYKAMSGAVFPSLNDAYIQKDMVKLGDLFRRSGINILIVGAGMGLLIICNAPLLVSFLPKDYGIVVPLTLILVTGRFVDVASGMNTELITISVYYRFFFWLCVALLAVLIILCSILIPRYGVYGAAWSATSALVLFNGAKIIFLWKKFGLLPFSKGSPAVLLAAIIAGATGYLLPQTGQRIPDLMLRSSAICIIYAGLLIWLKPSEDLRQYLQSIRQNRRLF